jgi:long-chain acyl-CoA synthetase
MPCCCLVSQPSKSAHEPGVRGWLPLEHIFGFTASMLLSLHISACNNLIPNPRDISALLKEPSKHRFHTFSAADTTFNAMALYSAFTSVNWSHLVLAVGGGMAVQQGTARLWLKTGCPICEGYGLSEASPAVTCNPVDGTAFSGDIGLPLPNTELALLDDSGQEVARAWPARSPSAGRRSWPATGSAPTKPRR